MRPALHFRAKKAKFSGCQSKKSSCSFLTNSDMMFQGQEAKKMIDLFNCPEMIKNVLKIVFRNYSNKKKRKIVDTSKQTRSEPIKLSVISLLRESPIKHDQIQK